MTKDSEARTVLPKVNASATLTVDEAHDYAQIFIDGKYIGKLDRRNGEKQLDIPACKEGAQLDILVEAMGRINFGRAIKDFKGITGSVTLKNGGRTTELKGWKVYNLEDLLRASVFRAAIGLRSK